MNSAIDFITNVLGNPVVMLGTIAYIGLMFLRRNVSDIVMGTIGTMMGYSILSAGTTIIGAPITLLTILMQRGLGTGSVLPLYWVVYTGPTTKFRTGAALIFIIGFVINILLAKSMPWKNLTTTIHLQFFWAGFMASIITSFGFSGITLITIGDLISSVYYWIATTISAHYLEPATTEHTSFVPNTIVLVIAGEAGRLFRKGGKSAEEIEFLSLPNWLKGSIITTRMAVPVTNSIFIFIVDPAIVKELTEGTPRILYVLVQSLTFGGGIAVVLYGVHTMPAELIPVFFGAIEKLLPSAVLGLDYPIVFPYVGIAVMLSFVFSLLDSILAVLVIAFTDFSPIVVPGVQINSSEGALVGVHVSARGGLKDCIFSALITGFILQFTVALAFPMTGHLMVAGGAYEAMDSSTIGCLVAELTSLFH